MPRTPAYVFRKDQERVGEDNSASTLITSGVGIEIVTRVLARAERTQALRKTTRTQVFKK
jgi:hypothetical protein